MKSERIKSIGFFSKPRINTFVRSNIFLSSKQLAEMKPHMTTHLLEEANWGPQPAIDSHMGQQRGETAVVMTWVALSLTLPWKKINEFHLL